MELKSAISSVSLHAGKHLKASPSQMPQPVPFLLMGNNIGNPSLFNHLQQRGVDLGGDGLAKNVDLKDQTIDVFATDEAALDSLERAGGNNTPASGLQVRERIELSGGMQRHLNGGQFPDNAWLVEDVYGRRNPVGSHGGVAILLGAAQENVPRKQDHNCFDLASANRTEPFVHGQKIRYVTFEQIPGQRFFIASLGVQNPPLAVELIDGGVLRIGERRVLLCL